MIPFQKNFSNGKQILGTEKKVLDQKSPQSQPKNKSGPFSGEKSRTKHLSKDGEGDIWEDSSQSEVELQIREIFRKMSSALHDSDLQSAEEYAKNYIRLARENWGKDGIDYAEALAVASKVYEAQNNITKFAELLLESANILKRKEWRRFYVHRAEKTADVFLSTSALLYRLNKFDDAKEWSLLALEIRKNIPCNEEEKLTANAKTYENAGAVCQQLGHYEEAGKYFDAAFRLCLEMSPTAPHTLEAMEILTNSLHIQGKTELAIARLDDYIKIVENILTKFAPKIDDDDDEFSELPDGSYSDEELNYSVEESFTSSSEEAGDETNPREKKNQKWKNPPRPIQ